MTDLSDLSILAGAGRWLFAGRRRAADEMKDDRQVAIELDQIKEQAAASPPSKSPSSFSAIVYSSATIFFYSHCRHGGGPGRRSACRGRGRRGRACCRIAVDEEPVVEESVPVVEEPVVEEPVVEEHVVEEPVAEEDGASHYNI